MMKLLEARLDSGFELSRFNEASGGCEEDGEGRSAVSAGRAVD